MTHRPSDHLTCLLKGAADAAAFRPGCTAEIHTMKLLLTHNDQKLLRSEERRDQTNKCFENVGKWF